MRFLLLLFAFTISSSAFFNADASQDDSPIIGSWWGFVKDQSENVAIYGALIEITGLHPDQYSGSIWYGGGYGWTTPVNDPRINGDVEFADGYSGFNAGLCRAHLSFIRQRAGVYEFKEFNMSVYDSYEKEGCQSGRIEIWFAEDGSLQYEWSEEPAETAVIGTVKPWKVKKQ